MTLINRVESMQAMRQKIFGLDDFKNEVCKDNVKSDDAVLRRNKPHPENRIGDLRALRKLIDDCETGELKNLVDTHTQQSIRDCGMEVQTIRRTHGPDLDLDVSFEPLPEDADVNKKQENRLPRAGYIPPVDLPVHLPVHPSDGPKVVSQQPASSTQGSSVSEPPIVVAETQPEEVKQDDDPKVVAEDLPLALYVNTDKEGFNKAMTVLHEMGVLFLSEAGGGFVIVDPAFLSDVLKRVLTYKTGEGADRRLVRTSSTWRLELDGSITSEKLQQTWKTLEETWDNFRLKDQDVNMLLALLFQCEIAFPKEEKDGKALQEISNGSSVPSSVVALTYLVPAIAPMEPHPDQVDKVASIIKAMRPLPQSVSPVPQSDPTVAVPQSVSPLPVHDGKGKDLHKTIKQLFKGEGNHTSTFCVRFRAWWITSPAYFQVKH